MTTRIRFPYDRRGGEDRRRSYSLEYFLEGGKDRRRRKDRRRTDERRTDWVRGSDWGSVWREFIDPEQSLPK
jgi:hypothetical protein